MIEIKPSIQEIQDAVNNSDKKLAIPIWYEIIADLETPVSAYNKVCKNKKYSFLLESVEGGENVARYSFIGADPVCVLKSDKNESIIFNTTDHMVIEKDSNPYDLLAKFIDKYETNDNIQNGLEYSPGAVGYFGFESIKHIEPKLQDIINNSEECESFPEAYFMIAGTVLMFDHVKHKIFIINNILVDSTSDIENIHNESKEKIQLLLTLLGEPHHLKPLHLNNQESNEKVESNISKKEWIKSVKKAKEHILAGDIFQVVLSQRFCIEKQKTETFDIYRALRSINPSPYLYYLNFDEFQIIGSSPEIMVQCSKDKTAYIRPIAGTRPRGINKEQDIEYAEELINDPKERAEHIMLIDLGRNDLGRVCKYGTVKVNDLMHIEKYSHVMHIVSDVTGELRDDLSAIDLTKACFPAGTVSGAPKVKALEIIYSLEKAARGPYAGCIGSFGFNGEANTAITIRTMLVKDNKVFIQAGAGIVADSDPELEYKETQNKAAALVQTIKRLELGS